MQFSQQPEARVRGEDQPAAPVAITSPTTAARRVHTYCTYSSNNTQIIIESHSYITLHPASCYPR